MNVLHVTRPQADAIVDGTLTLAPADGQADPDCWCTCPPDCCRGYGPDPGGCGWCWAKDTDTPCPHGSGLVAPSLSDPLGIAADGLLVCTVSVSDVVPIDSTPNERKGQPGDCCLFLLPGGHLGLYEYRSYGPTLGGWYPAADLSHLLPLLGPPEELVGRWAVLVKNPVPTSERCPACDGGVVIHADGGTSPCGLCYGDHRPCPPVPVAAAPVGTITEEDFDG